jgi:hypothetical protein
LSKGGGVIKSSNFGNNNKKKIKKNYLCTYYTFLDRSNIFRKYNSSGMEEKNFNNYCHRKNLSVQISSLFCHLENGGHIEFFRVDPKVILKLTCQRTCIESFMLSSPSEQFCQNFAPISCLLKL